MTDPNEDDGDPTARDQREIGREVVEQRAGLGSVMAHAYRGELDQATTWRQRLDQATAWPVTVIAAVLTGTFFSEDNPHSVLLVGVVVGVVTTFVGATLGLAFWPRERHAEGEFREGDPEAWTEDDTDDE
ncbi:DUF2270 domain-containing protein [Halorubrum sp. AD140]|uniref:DUF2270 domain-containing protein n=1 Tax=Halorubrum sp. AD140 TaxID=3050073 RepID=UPI002ACCF27B|nr:DUF2270 domain-containing protein [Halorubrum sp. AD140]MDZ5810599.1 DUF2270 domain-containing protein [Halorubrum sp. AD140]